jgi:hypothetical protein
LNSGEQVTKQLYLPLSRQSILTKKILLELQKSRPDVNEILRLNSKYEAEYDRFVESGIELLLYTNDTAMNRMLVVRNSLERTFEYVKGAESATTIEDAQQLIAKGTNQISDTQSKLIELAVYLRQDLGVNETLTNSVINRYITGN